MLKHSLLKVASQIVKYKINRWASRPIITQKRQLSALLKKGSKTIFGKDHNFKSISSYKDFKSKIPVRDYEELKKERKMFYGLESRYILQLHLGLRQGQSIYQLQKTVCQII